MSSTSYKSVGLRLLWSLVVVTVLFVFGITHLGYQQNGARVEPRAALGLSGLSSVMMPGTSDALSNDPKFREFYETLVRTASDASKEIGTRLNLSSMAQASSRLDKHLDSLNPAPAGGLPGHSLLDFARRGFKSTRSLEDRAGIASGIADSFMSALSGFGDDILGDLSGAAFFLGTGIGNGAAQGFNLSTATQANQVAAQVAAANNMKASGLNGAIQNIGTSLVANVAPAIKAAVPANSLQTLLQSPTVTSMFQPVALALGGSIGNGTSSGLKLTQANVAPATGSSIPDIVAALGFSLTDTVSSNINMTAIQAQGAAKIQSLAATTDFSGLALSFAQGIGNGTTQGLGLSKSTQQPPGGSDVANIAGSFGYGLTKSVASNVNTTMITSGLAANAPQINFAQIQPYLVPAASGFGTGLGQGAAVGLGLQAAQATVNSTGLDMETTVRLTTQNFASGLTSSFISNGTASKIASMVTSGGGGGLSALQNSSVNFGLAAQGVVRGFIQGAGDAATSVGGISAIMAGTADLSKAVIPNNTLSFNDSVGGAATGLGQGVGGQGLLVAIQLLQPGAAAQFAASGADPAAAAPSTDTTTTTAAANGTAARRIMRRTMARRNAELARRDTTFAGLNLTNFNITDLNLTSLVSSGTITTVAQLAIDDLTCTGIGGLASIGLGLFESGTIKPGNFSKESLKALLQQFPPGVITLNNSGNTYELDANNETAIINGSPVIRFVVVLVLHIVFALLIFATILPVVIMLDSLRDVLVFVGRPDILSKAPKWSNWLWYLVFAPFSLVVVVLGFLTVGNTKHLATSHGIIGLLTFIAGIATLVLHFLRRRQDANRVGEPIPSGKGGRFSITLRGATDFMKQIMLNSALASVITGFSDLASVSVCLIDAVPLSVAVGAGAGISMAANTAMGVWLVQWLLSRKRKSTAGNAESYPPEKMGLEEKGRPMEIGMPVRTDL